MVPGGSRCSRTPSASSSSSTLASKERTSYVNQNLTLGKFICYISKTNWFKTVPAWYREIKLLSEFLSDLVQLNHCEINKYQLCSSKIGVAHVYKLFSKKNWFKTAPVWYRVLKMLLDTLSHLVKSAIQQVLVMFIKNWHGTCLYTIFQRKIK